MNVLFLTTRLPYPPDSGGKVRDYNLLKGISKKHNVTLVSFIQNERELEHLQFLRPYCESIEAVEEDGGASFWLRIFISLFTKKPFTIAKFYSSEMKRKIYSLMDDNKVDLIHCSHLHMAQYVESIKNIPKILDEHNIEFIVIKRYLREQRNYIKKVLVFFLQYIKLIKYEPNIVQKFDHCLVVSHADKDSLELIAPNAPATIVPNGVDLDFYRSQDMKPQPNTLVFAGAMDWFPNEDAILYFYEKVWIIIKGEIKDARLYVVGRNPSNKILNLQRKEADIIVTGYTADVRPYVSTSAVYVVPLRIGGGSRLKIVEAMAMGKAIVSTSIGCEGIDVLNNEDIIIADEPEKFAANVIRLLKNNELCNKLGVNARRLAENKYSWEIIGKKLDEVYNGINRQRR